MVTFFLSVLFFFTAVAIHLVLCRKSKIKDLKTKLFIQLALTLLAVFWVLIWIFHLPMAVTNSAIYILMVPVYLIFYVSTELTSPSKKVLQIVEFFPGSTYEDIYKALERENFLMTRLIELQQCGIVVREGDRYRLSPAGQKFARAYDMYQKLLGREMGG